MMAKSGGGIAEGAAAVPRLVLCLRLRGVDVDAPPAASSVALPALGVSSASHSAVERRAAIPRSSRWSGVEREEPSEGKEGVTEGAQG